MSDLKTLQAEVRSHAEDVKCRWCNGSTKEENGDPCHVCKGTGSQKSFYPQVITAIKWPGMEGIFNAISFSRAKLGDWVSVRLASEDKNTYLGIYLGDWASSFGGVVAKDSTVLEITTGLGNPAIYVPDLKRIVRGYESWWGVINGPDDLQQITDQTIENVWYVRALKDLTERKETPE